MRSIIKLISLITLLFLILAPSPLHGQSSTNTTSGWPKLFHTSLWSTNAYYRAGEQVVEIAPTASSYSFGGNGKRTYGYSMEYEYWQTLTTGTGMELGSYDVKDFTFDHLAIMEDFRLVYFPDEFLLDKFAITFKSGAEQYFRDGTKDLEIGIGLDYNLFERSLRVETDIIQHFRTDSSKDGVTLRVGIQYIF